MCIEQADQPVFQWKEILLKNVREVLPDKKLLIVAVNFGLKWVSLLSRQVEGHKKSAVFFSSFLLGLHLSSGVVVEAHKLHSISALFSQRCAKNSPIFLAVTLRGSLLACYPYSFILTIALSVPIYPAVIVRLATA